MLSYHKLPQWKIWRHHLQKQYQMLRLIRTSKSWINSRSFRVWVFTHSMESLHHHKYKSYTSQRICTRYMEMISYIRRVSSQDVHFTLVLWSVAKIIPNLSKFNIFLSRIPFTYFDCYIISVHLPKVGLN